MELAKCLNATEWWLMMYDGPWSHDTSVQAVSTTGMHMDKHVVQKYWCAATGNDR